MLIPIYAFATYVHQERREDDANAYNGYDEYYYYWSMDEQERLSYHQKVTAYVSLALSLLFYVVSACHYSGAKLLPESGHNRSIQQAQAHGNITDRDRLVSIKKDRARRRDRCRENTHFDSKVISTAPSRCG